MRKEISEKSAALRVEDVASFPEDMVLICQAKRRLKPYQTVRIYV
jgi:uncharacterized protein YrrD